MVKGLGQTELSSFCPPLSLPFRPLLSGPVYLSIFFLPLWNLRSQFIGFMGGDLPFSPSSPLSKSHRSEGGRSNGSPTIICFPFPLPSFPLQYFQVGFWPRKGSYFPHVFAHEIRGTFGIAPHLLLSFFDLFLNTFRRCLFTSASFAALKFA